MARSGPSGGYRLLALDVDGTLLDGAGTLRWRTREAVARAARSGLQPVLCTGRRYRRAREIARELALEVPLVCNSGALVKDPAGPRTLWRADLAPETLAAVLAVFAEHGHLAVSFTDHDDPAAPDLLVLRYPAGRPEFDDYVRLNLEHARIDPGWVDRHAVEATPHFHLCAIGTHPGMLALQASLHHRMANQIVTFVQRSPRYRGWMCEVLHPEASKWSAVMHLAGLWGIRADQVCAVGDDRNDEPMLRGAGLGVAMGHAPPEVRAAADRVIGDHDSEALADLIDELIALRPEAS